MLLRLLLLLLQETGFAASGRRIRDARFGNGALRGNELAVRRRAGLTCNTRRNDFTNSLNSFRV
jgi:hypothetical protein